MTTAGAVPGHLLANKQITLGLLGWWKVKKAHERAAVIAEAQAWEWELKAKLVVVGEQWAGKQGRGASRKWTTKTIAGTGASWGRWLEALEIARHPSRRTIRMQLGDWRKAVHGRRIIEKEAAKRMAVRLVLNQFEVELGHDEAEAVCIGIAARRSEAVAKLQPQRRVKVRRAG